MIHKLDDFIKDRKSIVVFSVARSGTHLIMQYLLNNKYSEFHPNVATRGIENIFNPPPTNSFVFAGHIQSVSFKDEFLKSGMKGIYISRNPLDVIVSQAFYIKDKEPPHPLHKLFQSLSYEECMDIVIDGYDGMESIFEKYDGNDGWSKLDNVLHVKYEDLVKTICGVDYKYFFRSGKTGEWKNFKKVNWHKVYKLAEDRGYKVR